MRILMLSCLALTALILLFAGCSSTYWSRPGAELPDLAAESHACYASAVGGESPAALPSQSPRGSGRLLPSTEPPPRLWERSPGQAGFSRFDEQSRYERCMQQRGWRATRS
jgi:hypothetical protein